MGAEWPCNTCGQMIDGKYPSEHACDPEDIANLLRAESEDAAQGLQWQLDRIEGVLSILAEAALSGFHNLKPDDVSILRAFIAEQIAEQKQRSPVPARAPHETRHRLTSVFTTFGVLLGGED